MAEQFSVTVKTGETVRGWYWKADEAEANLTVITGMNEYAFRYDGFARWMNQKKINVWVLDAFGQGLNASSIEKQEIWPRDGFKKNVEAIHLMIQKAKKNGLPTTHMGHSMGSFMTQSLIERYHSCADGIILCGSNGGQKALMDVAHMMATLMVTKKNRDLPNPFLTRVSLGAYAKAVKDRKTDLDWLSYNEENVQSYAADPYCGHMDTGGFWLEFTRGMREIWDLKVMEHISKTERILILAGEEDPVGRCGAGPKWLKDTYRKLGLGEVTMKLYPHMRHEIHNEDGKEEVLSDIAAFVKSHKNQ